MMCFLPQTASVPVESSQSCQKLGKKRPRKEVRFSEATVIESPAAAPGLWYGQYEITWFKLEVKDYITSRANREKVESRGLERYDQERMENKLLANSCVLHAIRTGASDEKVASIAEKLSAWSRDQAFKIGCQDFCHAYYPNMVGVLPELLDPSVSSKSPTNRLAKLSAQEGRRAPKVRKITM